MQRPKLDVCPIHNVSRLRDSKTGYLRSCLLCRKHKRNPSGIKKKRVVESSSTICKECGKPRDTPKEWSSVLCLLCFRVKSKTRRRALQASVKNGMSYAPNGALDPNATYLERVCTICTKKFVPRMAKHIRCKECRLIGRDVLARMCGDHRCNKKLTATGASVDIVARHYLYDTHCIYCARPYTSERKKSFDHIIPVHMGGNSEASNIAICCIECNRSKAGLMLDHWIANCAGIAAQSVFDMGEILRVHR